MQLTTTMSQKGQIVIPQVIRTQLNLKPATILRVSIKNNAIVATPVPSTSSVFGMFETKKPIKKETIKQSFREAVTQKHKLS